MKALFPRLVLIGLTFAAVHPGVAAPSPTPSPAASASPTPTPTPAGLALTEIAPQGQAKLAVLNGIEPEDSPDKISDAARVAFRDLTGHADALVEEGNKAAAPGPGSSLDILRDQLAAWKKLQDAIDEQTKALGDRGASLENEGREIDEIQKSWKATKAATDAKDANAPPEIRELVNNVLAAAAAARNRVATRRTAVLSLQTTLNDLGTRIAAGLAKAQAANTEAVKTLLVADSGPLWTPDGQPRPDFFARWRESAREQWDQTRSFAELHWGLFALHGTIFAGLLAAMFWLRRRVARWTEEEPHLARAAPIFRVPVATALALSFILKGDLYAGTPPLFRALLGAVALAPTVIILLRVLDRRLGLIVYSLVVFYAADRLRLATAAFAAANRWIFCVELAGAIVVYLLLIRTQRRVHPEGRASLGRGLLTLYALAIGVLAAALGASVLGYVRLGTLLGEAVLFSSYLAVALYTLLRVIEGFIAIVLRVRPVTASRVVVQHRELVQDRVYRAFRAAAVILWVAVTLDRFQVLQPIHAWVTAVLDYRLPLGATKVTPGSILAFAVAIWASFLISRAARFFLEEEVYERVRLSAGLPYAISTMLNYSILVVGFLVALGMLGVDLTKITIVAGAFSVGLGFGLQNIINNFVSGIILLFERPVKVGDVIQIGDAVGEVRRIGIRASIVRTRDGSDVILPNGNLISNQVINWTYGDRARAVEIPLNIAAGEDPARVLKLLLDTVKAQPGAEDRPAPSVYITALTAAGLSVVVRAWTDHYEDWIKVRSDLSAALATTLAREQVKLT